jgi:hypothetical protein
LNKAKLSPGLIFPIDSYPFGRSYEEWAVSWWRWLLSIPKSASPAIDTSGKNAYSNQKHPNVIFLCQTYEESELNPTRCIDLPKNTAIFIPIINWISLLNHDGQNDKEMLDTARERMDVVRDMEFSINGFSIKNQLHDFRILTPFFDVELPEDNVVGLSPGSRRAVSDGFWVFVKPLQAEGCLSTFGSCSSGITRIGVQYEITISG